AAGPLFLDHRQSAGFEQRLPADSAPAHFRSPGPFRCGLALMVPRYGTAHVYLAPVLRFGFFQKGNLDNAATLGTGSALARQVSAQADFLVAKGALKINGLGAGGGGRRWGFGLLRQRGQGLSLEVGLGRGFGRRRTGRTRHCWNREDLLTSRTLSLLAGQFVFDPDTFPTMRAAKLEGHVTISGVLRAATVLSYQRKV